MSDIEPTSSGYGVIRPCGHTFTRRTYRVARKRAIRAMLEEREMFVMENGRWPLWETESRYNALHRAAAGIVVRGRREMGMWA